MDIIYYSEMPRKVLIHVYDTCLCMKSGVTKLGMKCLATLNVFPQSMEIRSKSTVEKGIVNVRVLELLSVVSD